MHTSMLQFGQIVVVQSAELRKKDVRIELNSGIFDAAAGGAVSLGSANGEETLVSAISYQFKTTPRKQRLLCIQVFSY